MRPFLFLFVVVESRGGHLPAEIVFEDNASDKICAALVSLRYLRYYEEIARGFEVLP